MDRTRIESVARFGWIGAAAIVAILVFQVAQPWRGYLAGWLVFVVSGAWVAHRCHVIEHHKGPTTM